jgi:hypothetical protein
VRERENGRELDNEDGMREIGDWERERGREGERERSQLN